MASFAKVDGDSKLLDFQASSVLSMVTSLKVKIMLTVFRFYLKSEFCVFISSSSQINFKATLTLKGSKASNFMIFDSYSSFSKKEARILVSDLSF